MSREQQRARQLPSDLYRSLLAEKLGRPVASCRVAKIKWGPDGELRSFVIQAKTKRGIFYLRKNYQHEMANVFRSYVALAAALPPGYVPKSSYYISEIEAVITSALAGKELLKHPPRQQERILLAAGKFLYRVHHLPSSTRKKITTRSGSLEELLITLNRGTLAKVARANPEFAQQLRAPLPVMKRIERAILRREPRRIILGDIHPGNLIYRSGHAAIVDLDDVTLGSPWRDVGSMLEQLSSFLHFRHPGIAKKSVDHLQALFLRGYDRSVRPNTRPLIFYQAWIAWRNALYYADKERPNYTGARYALKRCHAFLRRLN